MRVEGGKLRKIEQIFGGEVLLAGWRLVRKKEEEGKSPGKRKSYREKSEDEREVTGGSMFA